MRHYNFKAAIIKIKQWICEANINSKNNGKDVKKINEWKNTEMRI